MAYWKTILKGSLGNVEVWSTSVSWGVFGIAPDNPDQATTDQMALALRTFLTTANLPTGLKALMSTSASIDSVRVELRSENEITLSVSEQLLAAPATGTGVATKTPQDSVVLSLRTSTPGARGRGRMYWPALGAAISNTFQLSSPTQATVAADAKTLLSAIGTQMNNVYIGNASARRVVASVRSITDHLNRDITSIQVGSVLDTQRRRRDSLPESYVNVTYP